MINTNHTSLGQIWSNVKKMFRTLAVARISIVMVVLMFIIFFCVDQIKDAIVALGNFASLYQFIIFGIIGILWAFLIWYWARVFYYIEYHNIKDLPAYEKAIIIHTPRILGALSLLTIAVAFIIQASLCQLPNRLNPIRIIGIVFLVLTIVFLLVVYLRRKIFKLEAISEREVANPENRDIVPFKNLPVITQKILILSTIIAVILLVFLILSPIRLTIYLGDGVTIFIGCFCIWLPLCYWIRYFSLKLRFPLFLILFIIIAVFSQFNSNKNVRLTTEQAGARISLTDYYNQWQQKITPGPDGRKPMLIVLSEGGGIRAAYWSAKLMARIQKDYPAFRNDLFGISSVSGGSFGATVFDSLLKCNVPNQPDTDESPFEIKTREIIGKDFLSPIIACMFTREIIQLLIPVPISSFDHAKVFEETWEFWWQDRMNKNRTFSAPLLSLWKDNPPNLKIPPLFINTTQVENGYPITLSPINVTPNINTGIIYLPKDFYRDIESHDVRISTASLLSARFTYIGPAGTIIQNNRRTIGLVDGGYFENTGANTAYHLLISLKNWYENNYLANVPSQTEKDKASIYHIQIKPVIIYLKNGTKTENVKTSGKTIFYQLLAPIQTLLQVRDAHTINAVSRLQELADLYDGKFITFDLLANDQEKIDIPLGWALSKKAQEQIDAKVNSKKISEQIKTLGEYIK